jgi:hypothetical protein
VCCCRFLLWLVSLHAGFACNGWVRTTRLNFKRTLFVPIRWEDAKTEFESSTVLPRHRTLCQWAGVHTRQNCTDVGPRTLARRARINGNVHKFGHGWSKGVKSKVHVEYKYRYIEVSSSSEHTHARGDMATFSRRALVTDGSKGGKSELQNI